MRSDFLFKKKLKKNFLSESQKQYEKEEHILEKCLKSEIKVEEVSSSASEKLRESRNTFCFFIYHKNEK